MAYKKIDLETIGPDGDKGDLALVAFGKVNDNIDETVNNFAALSARVDKNQQSSDGKATVEMINSEASARKGADDALKQGLSTEVSERKTAVTTVTQAVDKEASDRKAADDSLKKSLDTEVSTRASAVTQVSNSVSALDSRVSGLDSRYFKTAGGVISGNTTVVGGFHTIGVISSTKGFQTRQGSDGTPSGNNFNLSWSDGRGDGVGVWVDTVFLGKMSLTSSDRRLKESIEPVVGGDLAKIKQGQPTTWFFKDKEFWGPNKHRSFVAQDLHAIDPLLVYGDGEAVDAQGKPIPQGLDLPAIISVLWGALKEETALRESLEGRVVSLEAQRSH